MKTLAKKIKEAKAKRAEGLKTFDEAVLQLEASNTELLEVINEIIEEERTLALAKADAKEVILNNDIILCNIEEIMGGNKNDN